MTQTITPYLLYEDGEAAIEFLTRAFGFSVVDRAIGGAGGLHAELEVAPGGGRIYLGQPPGEFRNPAQSAAPRLRTSSWTTLITATNVRNAGAEIIEEPTDLPSATAATAVRTRRATSGTSRNRSRAPADQVSGTVSRRSRSAVVTELTHPRLD